MLAGRPTLWQKVQCLSDALRGPNLTVHFTQRLAARDHSRIRYLSRIDSFRVWAPWNFLKTVNLVTFWSPPTTMLKLPAVLTVTGYPWTSLSAVRAFLSHALFLFILPSFQAWLMVFDWDSESMSLCGISVVLADRAAASHALAASMSPLWCYTRNLCRLLVVWYSQTTGEDNTFILKVRDLIYNSSALHFTQVNVSLRSVNSHWQIWNEKWCEKSRLREQLAHVEDLS